MTIQPKQPHDACQCAWCELYRLPEKWRSEAATQHPNDPRHRVHLQHADELQRLFERAGLFARRRAEAQDKEPTP